MAFFTQAENEVTRSFRTCADFRSYGKLESQLATAANHELVEAAEWLGPEHDPGMYRIEFEECESKRRAGL
jgi:hypothetical protein